MREGGVAVFSITPDDGGARIEEEIVLVAECRLRDADERKAFRDTLRGLARDRHGVDTRVALAPNGSLPRTSSGKLSRAKARRLFLDGAFETIEAV